MKRSPAIDDGRNDDVVHVKMSERARTSNVERERERESDEEDVHIQGFGGKETKREEMRTTFRRRRWCIKTNRNGWHYFYRTDSL